MKTTVALVSLSVLALLAPSAPVRAGSLEQAKTDAAAPFAESLGSMPSASSFVAAGASGSSARAALTMSAARSRKSVDAPPPPDPLVPSMAGEGRGTRALMALGGAAGLAAAVALCTTVFGAALLSASAAVGFTEGTLEGKVMGGKPLADAMADDGVRRMMSMSFFGPAIFGMKAGRTLGHGARKAAQGVKAAATWVGVKAVGQLFKHAWHNDQ